MATTPNFAIPYPVDTDLVIDGDNAMRAIAERVDAILAASLLNSGPLGRRNVIRNGDMNVAQRGLGPFTAQIVTADGWLKSHSGGTHTVDVQVGFVGATAGINGARSAVRSTLTGSGGTTADYCQLIQRIEAVDTLANRQVTVSFVAYAAAGIPRIGLELVQTFGTGGAPSPSVFTPVGSVTLGTTAKKYTLTATLPSIVGKALGVPGTDYLQLNFWLSAGSAGGSDWTVRSSNTPIQNAVITITDVQLETGATATPFERLAQQAQLSWCQRYYWRRSSIGVTDLFAPGFWTSSSGALYHLRWPVPMRVAPTVAASAPGGFAMYSPVNGGVTCTALTFSQVSIEGAAVSAGGAATGALGHGSHLFGVNNNPAVYLEAGAEL